MVLLLHRIALVNVLLLPPNRPALQAARVTLTWLGVLVHLATMGNDYRINKRR
jgi:hypothetical protein